MRPLFLALFWTALAVTLYFTLRPITVPVPGSDKTQHAVTFGVLMALAIGAYPRSSWLAWALLLSFVGGAIEVVQPFFGRSQDVRDWIADMIGIAVALALAAGLSAWIRRRKAN